MSPEPHKLRPSTPSPPKAVAARRTWRWFDVIAFTAVPAAIAALLTIYLLWPDFYLAHVLEERHREELAVEKITFAAALSAGVLLVASGARFWRRATSAHSLSEGRPGTELPTRSAAILTLVFALACLLFAGEEVDWGQHYFGWKTPSPYRPISRATNLHNAPLVPFRAAANLFVLFGFVLLPIAWRLGLRELPAARGLRVAIPEAGVVFSIVLASLWRWVKPVYIWIVETPLASPGFFADFLEQINEQREMLTALSLLIYAAYRARIAIRLGAPTA